MDGATFTEPNKFIGVPKGSTSIDIAGKYELSCNNAEVEQFYIHHNSDYTNNTVEAITKLFPLPSKKSFSFSFQWKYK